MLAPAIRESKIVDASGRPMMAFGHAREGFGRQLANWHPPLQTADAAILSDMDSGNARADDVVRNNAIASGALQIHVDNIVGHLFKLSYKPKWSHLGIAENDLLSFVSDVEHAFFEYAEDPVNCWIDAEQKRTFTMIIRETVSTHTRHGEDMALAQWLDRPGALLKTAIRQISPKRICNPDGRMDENRLRGGIEFNHHGAAEGYWLRNHDISGMGSGMGYKWVRVPRNTRHGRQQFLHTFEPTEDNQSRGANQFMTTLEQLHMLPKLQNHKLQNFLISSMYAAVIESELGSAAAHAIIGADQGSGEEIGRLNQWMATKADYHQGANIRMNGVKIPHLTPGENLKLLTSGNADNGYVDLEKSVLRWCARGLNVPFETLAQNWSDVSYSAARASILENWRYFMGRRKIIAARKASMIFRLLFEEMVARKIITLPKARFGFYEAINAWTHAEWIGAGRLAIDGLKEVKESVLRLEAGLSTFEEECALLGKDYQEVLAQQVREVKERREKGLPLPSWLSTQTLSPDGQSAEETVSKKTGNDR